MDIISKCDLSGNQNNSENSESASNNKPNSRLYNFVDEKGILGATISDIKDNFSKNIMDELKELIENSQIFRVGIVKTRFVSEKFSHSWHLHSFDIKRKQREEVGLVNVNEKVCIFKKWLKVS